MTETINGVPLELLKRAVQIPSKASVEENHAAIVDRGRAQAELRDMLNAVPVPEAKAQVYEPLVCDYCNAETQDPWHGSGMLNGAESRHIHACSQCRNLLPTTKAQCVVMPERWNVPRPMWKDARHPYGNPLNHADIEAAEKFNLALDEVARLNAAPVQQVSVPASAFASRAITHYEAALLAAFPSGSSGEVFNQWNEARRVLAAAPAVPSQGEQVRVVPVEPTEAMRKAAQDKLASEGLIVTDWLIHTAYSAMLANAPSPAGVDGLNTDRNAAFKACPESGCDWGSFYLGWKARGEVEQAIIDGLRAEIGAQRVKTCIALKERNDAREERDQQAQRIGELEGLLRDERAYGPLGVSCQNGVVARCVCRMCRLRHIDAALSAGKEGE